MNSESAEEGRPPAPSQGPRQPQHVPGMLRCSAAACRGCACSAGAQRRRASRRLWPAWAGRGRAPCLHSGGLPWPPDTHCDTATGLPGQLTPSCPGRCAGDVPDALPPPCLRRPAGGPCNCNTALGRCGRNERMCARLHYLMPPALCIGPAPGSDWGQLRCTAKHWRWPPGLQASESPACLALLACLSCREQKAGCSP